MDFGNYSDSRSRICMIHVNVYTSGYLRDNWPSRWPWWKQI